jgi:hypothetical protein
MAQSDREFREQFYEKFAQFNQKQEFDFFLWISFEDRTPKIRNYEFFIQSE